MTVDLDQKWNVTENAKNEVSMNKEYHICSFQQNIVMSSMFDSLLLSGSCHAAMFNDRQFILYILSRARKHPWLLLIIEIN